MASKKGKTGIVGFLAFTAIIFNAVAWILQYLANKFWAHLSEISNFLVSISSFFLLIVAVYTSYDFAKRQKRFWRIIWWLLTIVSLLAVFFGIGVNFLK